MSSLEGLAHWIETNQEVVAQTDQMIAEMKSTRGIDFAMLTVAAKQLRDMISQS